MIDNSIIIIENIRQYRIMGYAVSDACVQGANEVIRPLISSALTTCSVFLPLIFLSGIGGALFYDQALSISIALGTSLGIAYILLPTLLRLISSKNSKGIIAASSPSFYKKSVNGVLQYPWLTLILFIGLVGGLFAQLPKLKQETFPELTRNALTVAIDWNEAINLSTNEQRNLDLIKHLDTLVTKYSLDLGEHQFLLNAAQRDINESNAVLYTNQSIEKLQVEIQQYFLTYYPQASIQLAPLKNIFDELFNASEPNLIMLIQSASSQQVPALATAQPIFDYLDQNAFFYAIPPQEIVYNLQIRKEKALLFQVDYETIYHQLKTLFNQNQVSMLRTSEAFIPIIISQEEGNLYELMQSARVYNQQGDLLPLSNFIQIQQQTAYKTINAGKTGEALSIALDTVSQPLMEELKKHTAQNTNLALSFTGAFFEQQQYLRELSIILGIVLVLLYLILAAQFESLMLPFIVLLTVPIGISGAIGLLYFMNETINLIAIIGMIVLSGIVVNDAILKIDKMEKERRNHSLKEAIHIGGQRRLKPILMTTLTTILALIPILFSDGLGAELQGPLAFTLIGGLILGTIASLYFIPVLYFLLRKKYLPKYRLPNEIY
jgi:multidrug efflux pump subunit AcrB